MLYIKQVGHIKLTWVASVAHTTCPMIVLVMGILMQTIVTNLASSFNSLHGEHRTHTR